ncbi:HAD family hydrolase [Allorhizobium pseudoryzae]|uniref:HAD family hydrolase n=1 Tax=Allorhizobium pseudoryzae TaxID=379684 RepID=UPI003D035B04
MVQRQRKCSDRLMVFDVGGVFIALDAEKRRVALEAGGRWRADAAPRQDLLEINRTFRLGQISEDQYLNAACAIYGLPVEPVLAAETALLAGVLDEMVTYVRELRSRYRVVCLSNTQALHWRHVIDEMLGQDLFDETYLSHEMGMEKPSDDIYLALQGREDVRPEQILFVDDTLENVNTARRLGWHAIHHDDARRTIATIEHWLAGDVPRRGLS